MKTNKILRIFMLILLIIILSSQIIYAMDNTEIRIEDKFKEDYKKMYV